MAFIQKLGQLRATVASYANLPITENVQGDIRIALDTGDAYVWMIASTSGPITNWAKITTSTYGELVGAPISTALSIDDAVKTIKTLAINMALLAYDVAIQFQSSIDRMFDGVVNRFRLDEEGIDASKSSNEIWGGAFRTNVGTNSIDRTFYLPNKNDLELLTLMLIHGDGVNGSSNIKDLLRCPIVSHGVVTDTTTKKFGTGSLKFDGASYLDLTNEGFFRIAECSAYYEDVPNNLVGNVSALDFWVYFTQTGEQPIFCSGAGYDRLHNSVAEGDYYLIEKDASEKIHLLIALGGGGSDVDGIHVANFGNSVELQSTNAVSLNTWYHVAIQRYPINVGGAEMRMYINGSLSDSSKFTLPGLEQLSPDYPAALSMYIGKKDSSYLHGYVDEIRFSGDIEYSGNFTPMTRAYNTATTPAPTPTIVDISAGAKTVTALGNARMSGTNPLLGNASLYLDGINSYLSLADSDDWTLTDSGLVDAQTVLLLHLDGNVTDSETTPKTVTNNNVTFGTGKFSQAGSFNGTSSYLSIPDSDDFYFGTGNFTIEGWFNFSVLQASLLFSQNNGAGSAWFFIMQADHTLRMQFKLNSVIIADYGTVSVPNILINTWNHIAVVRNGSNCYMFLNGQSLTLSGTTFGTKDVGNVNSALYIGQLGGGYFNGLMDELRISKGVARYLGNFNPPTTPVAQVLSDYTIDLWVCPTQISDYTTIAGQSSSDAKRSWLMYFNATTHYVTFQIYSDGSNASLTLVAPVTIPLSAWTHIAVVQYQGTVKIYINGVMAASATGKSMMNSTNPLLIGLAQDTSTTYFNGFMEEVRISNNARWTAAFTPPAVEYSSDSYTKLLLPLNVQTVPNMVLQSVGYVANYVPTSARVVIFEEDIDVMEPNVDLKIEVSRDGGATFTTCLIAKDQEFGDGTLNLFTGSVDLSSQPNGELMVWKLTTENNKDCRIRGVSLNWR